MPGTAGTPQGEADSDPLDPVDPAATATARARAARLLLAHRHGNQVAFDGALDGLFCDEQTRDLVAALCWIAGEGVRQCHRTDEAADRELHRLASLARYGERWAETHEDAAPDVAVLLTAVTRDDVERVRTLLRATPDTTYLLGGLVQAFALLLPAVPRPYLRRVLDELSTTPPAPPTPDPAPADPAGADPAAPGATSAEAATEAAAEPGPPSAAGPSPAAGPAPYPERPRHDPRPHPEHPQPEPYPEHREAEPYPEPRPYPGRRQQAASPVGGWSGAPPDIG